MIAACLIVSPALRGQAFSSVPGASTPEKEPAQDPAAAAGATQPPVPSPPSVARVREKLEKPPPVLTAPLPKADFEVHVEVRRPLLEIFDVPPWATEPLARSRICPPRSGSLPPAQCGPPPGFGFDPGSLIRAVKRAYNERAAQVEVQREIANYCAAQPDGGLGIEICARSSGAR
jgi:hypothetical protein